MVKMAQQLTPKELETAFCKVTIETIEAFRDLIKGLYEADITSRTTEEVDAIIILADGYGKKLIGMFLEKHKHWPRLLKRDLAGLAEDVPKLFEGMTADMSVLAVPVNEFLKHQETEEKKRNPKFPHTQEDLDGLWEYFDELMRIAHEYNKMTKMCDLGEYEVTEEFKKLYL